MTLADQFPEITRQREPLAPYTHLRIGGDAEFLVQPRDLAELKAVLVFCKAEKVPLRMLGGGHNLLVRDEPVMGVVMRLSGTAFSGIQIHEHTITALGGTPLFELIAESVKHNLAGLETLIGIRGTVGGSVRCNVGDRNGEIGQSVRQVTVLQDDGQETVRNRDELSFGVHQSDLDEPVILSVEFELRSDKTEALLQRMRRAWITRKSHEPPLMQPTVRMFRDPPGQSATTLIQKSGLVKYRVGNAEVNERNGNYLVAHPGTTAKDVLRLIDHVRLTIKEHTGIELITELNIW